MEYNVFSIIYKYLKNKTPQIIIKKRLIIFFTNKKTVIIYITNYKSLLF